MAEAMVTVLNYLGAITTVAMVIIVAVTVLGGSVYGWLCWSYCQELSDRLHKLEMERLRDRHKPASGPGGEKA